MFPGFALKAERQEDFTQKDNHPERSHRPTRLGRARSTTRPDLDACMVQPNRLSQALGVRFERRVAEKTAQIERCVVRRNVQPDQAICRVAKRPSVKALVLSEKCDPRELMEDRNNISVFDAKKGHFATYLAEGNAPRPEQRCLVLRKVFVQQVQAAANARSFRFGLRTGRSSGRSQALPASLTASATAASGMRPPQGP